MRVLHLIKTSVGAAWALRQVRELVKLGIEIHVAIPPGGPLVPQYEAAGAVVHLAQFALPIRYPQQWPRLFSHLRQLVECVKPDVIHSHFVGTTLTMRMALGRRHPTPRLFQVPGPLHLEHAFFRRAEIATAGPRDYWMGSCSWTRDRYIASGIPDDRVFLSYYGCDIDQFERRTPGKLRDELGLEPDTQIVGMVAFMYPPKRYLGQRRGLKGHEDLIDALAICMERDPKIVGVFVGGAWNKADAYERKVRTYGTARLGERARFLGTRDDVPELYPDFDVAVHPSHSENVGGAAESLLLGVPTIATNIGGFPDLVRHGETGWLVPPRDPKQLADAIIDALSSRERARTMAYRGQQLARQVMDIRNNTATVVRAYEAILEGQGATSP